MRTFLAGPLLAATILGLVDAAAGDDLGLRRREFQPWSDEVASVLSVPRSAITLPLTITPDRRLHVRRWVQLAPLVEPQVVFPRRPSPPGPSRPAVVSLFQDGTLRNGDAVMLADGIHVFHGSGTWPPRPRDFVRLTRVASLDWHLRQSLDTLDRNPPIRWTSLDAPSG